MAVTFFLAQLASTFFMTGLIWFVQIVHYPLFPLVGDQAFPRYERLHAHRTGWVVFPPMLVELLTAFAALHPNLRPPRISPPEAILSAALVLLIWLSTALLQIPVHNTLDRTPTPALMRRLVLSNWLRTAAWTARSALLLSMLTHLLNQTPIHTQSCSALLSAAKKPASFSVVIPSAAEGSRIGFCLVLATKMAQTPHLTSYHKLVPGTGLANRISLASVHS